MNEIKTLFELLEMFKTPSFDKIPEIELYMDQVLTYIKKQLPPVRPQDKENLTGSMINNYVKDNVIKNPKDKKYDKESIAALIMVANLKRVLPISDIKQIFFQKTDGIQPLYSIYQKQLETVIKEIETDGPWVKQKADLDLTEIALSLAVDASIKSYIAHMLISSSFSEPVKEKKKKQDKESKDKSAQN
ncbi:MAG: DUF1836 domain-containing protein [Acholeplasma sp.]|nr:DUF1836 domain-containing protein [Acholeplasma sp.]